MESSDLRLDHISKQAPRSIWHDFHLWQRSMLWSTAGVLECHSVDLIQSYLQEEELVYDSNQYFWCWLLSLTLLEPPIVPTLTPVGLKLWYTVCKSLARVTTALEPAIKNSTFRQFSTKVELILTLPYNTHQTYEYFWIKHDLGQKYYARGLNSRPSDHDSTFHVTEMPALTTWPSVTSKLGTFELIALCVKFY